MLDEHLWAHVLQAPGHSAGPCQGGYELQSRHGRLGSSSLTVPVHMPSEGMSQSYGIYVGLSVLHINMTGRVLTCPWRH